MSTLNLLFLELILCIIFNFIRNWSMKSYSATITCSRTMPFVPHDLLTPKGVPHGLLIQKEFKFYNRIHQSAIFRNFKPIFLKICFSLVVTFVLKLWLSALTLSVTFLIFKQGLITFVALPVFILNANFWKVIMKC